jgi:hypothetical protein
MQMAGVQSSDDLLTPRYTKTTFAGVGIGLTGGVPFATAILRPPTCLPSASKKKTLV